LFNKRDDLLILIAGKEPDLISITEVLPKANFAYTSSSRVDIPKFFRYRNFYPDAEPVVGIRGICIYVSNKLVSSVRNSVFHCKLFRIKINFNGSNSTLVGWVYRSPSSDSEERTNSLCQLLSKAINFTSSHLICDFNYSSIDCLCLTSSNLVLKYSLILYKTFSCFNAL